MEKKQVKKFANIYMSIGMSIGMCFGISVGMLFGMVIFPDNMAIGMCFGLAIGMGFGIAAGSAMGATKDKRLCEKMMEITKIEAIYGSSDVMIFAADKNGLVKEFRVAEKKIKDERFAVCDRVAEETDGSLISLESK